MQTYGDYFSPTTFSKATAEGAVAARSAIPRFEFAQNHWVDLLYVPEDLLTDEYPLTAIEYQPDGNLAPRLYTQRELERVAELKAGDASLLNHGAEWKKLASERPAAPKPFAAPQAKKEEKAKEKEKPEGNSLQTGLEVKMATDPKIIEAIKSEFTKISLERCANDFKPVSAPITTPTPDGREAPIVVVVTRCLLGFLTPTTFFLPVIGFDSRRTICTAPFKFEDTRNFLFTEKQKSTKVNFQLGVNIAKLPGVTLPPNGSLTPKEGDPAFKDNQRLQQPDPSGKLVGVDFDFGLIRQYVKVSVKEFRRVLFETPGEKCTELG